VASFLALGVQLFALPSFGQIDGTRRSVSSVLKFGWTEKDPKVKRKYMTVEVGDSTNSVFDPSFMLTAFNGESWFRVNLSTAEHLMGKAGRMVSMLNGKDQVLLTTDKIAHEIKAQGENGFEWDIILYEKPDTNVFTYSIETKGIDFFKQSPLTPEEMAGGHERPDSVVNAYVMYHSAGKNNYIYDDGYAEIYENGGIGTIYRPKAWDSAGNTVWCDHVINLKAGTYSKIVPQEFLDSAVYPITIDPQFGNTTGGSNTAVGSNAWGLAHSDYFVTTSAASTIDSMYIKMKSYESGDFTIDAAAYTIDGDNRPETKTGNSVTVTGNGGTATVYGQQCSIALAGSTTYTLAIGDDTNVGRFYYDNLANRCSRQTVNDDLVSSWTHGIVSDYAVYLYAVYSVDSGGEVSSSRRRRLGR
jgi:hypothetical protein